MGLDHSFNVRISVELKRRLEAVAARTPLKVADLIRLAIQEYCERIEEQGMVTIPVPSGALIQISAGEMVMNDGGGAPAPVRPEPKVSYRRKRRGAV